MHILAVDDTFVTDRKPNENIYTSAGIDAESIVNSVIQTDT